MTTPTSQTGPTVIDPLVAPAGLDLRAERLWRYGDGTHKTGDGPVPGDLWIATTDTGHDVGLVLVQSVTEYPADETAFEDAPARGYVIASAVTLTDVPASGTSLLLTDTPLGLPLVWHPEVSTGMDFRALTRRIGNVVDAFSLIKGTRWVFGEVAHPPLPVHGAGRVDEDGLDDHIADLCARGWVLGDSYSEFSSARDEAQALD
jgi:hypothetical protein